jgi:Protein of unknown function (DUF1194)
MATTSFGRIACLAVLATFTAAALAFLPAVAEDSVEVDTALILAVDVSDSVDAQRYLLQMEGIARALEDDSVIGSITSGSKGGILLSLVTWTDHAEVGIDWQHIRSADDARRVAGLVRSLPQRTGEYTCMSRMLAMLKESVVPSVPGKATRVVIDVSGDGIDNCSEPINTARERDELVAQGVTINGLPIMVKGENDVVGSGAYRAPGYELKGLLIGPGTHQSTMEDWYREHVIGGPSGFLIAAQGFEDFGRAFRQKFVTEISAKQ